MIRQQALTSCGLGLLGATITACQRVARWQAALALLMKADVGAWSPGGEVVHNAVLSVPEPKQRGALPLGRFEKATQWELELPHVNLVFIGPSGSGKSTMLGHLIAESGAIDAWSKALQLSGRKWEEKDSENLHRIFDEAKERGHPERCYAWILDKLSCERQRGNSMYVAMWRLASRRCRFTIMDAW
eukprot:s77_g4.t1